MMNLLRRINLNSLLNHKSTASTQVLSIFCNRFGDFVGNGSKISRDWIAQLWIEERKRKNDIKRRTKKDRLLDDSFTQSVQANTNEGVFYTGFNGGGFPQNLPEEAKLAPLLARSSLLITRDIEWGNIMFAFEQESRYVIVDASFPQSPAGYIREQSNIIFRQLLRTRRPFTAQVVDAAENEIFTIHRPIWFINSTIYAEVDGKEIGVVQRRWHLWRRIYDLYLGNKQFAVVENPGFWNWTFTLKDENDNVLAQIDRDWRGVGLELFTDAGQYVIRFGDDHLSPTTGLASTIAQLEVARPLSLAERAIALALAISLDSDYFSKRGGWGLPFLVATE